MDALDTVIITAALTAALIVICGAIYGIIWHKKERK